MDPITLTAFLDFVSGQGASKVRIVRDFLAAGYDVRTDFYKRMREAIVAVHRDDKPMELVDIEVERTGNTVKKAHFPAVADGHRHFVEQYIAKGEVQWFAPLRRDWVRNGIAVRVNPELGLFLDGVPHLVKLHFKKDKLRGNRVQVVTQLMREALADEAPPNCVMAALDVRRGRLLAPAPDSAVSVQLDGEVAFWSAVAAALHGAPK